LSTEPGGFDAGGAGLWSVPLSWHIQAPDVFLV